MVSRSPLRSADGWTSTTPFPNCRRPGGPPGQTRTRNRGPLIRHENRVKTHSRWRLRHPELDCYVWLAPSAARFLVTRAGTLYLGDGPSSRAVRPSTRTVERTDQPARTAG